MNAVKTTPPQTQPPKLQGCTNIKLRQLTRQVSRHYDAEVGKVGLKTTQYSLLSYVAKLGPLRPVDLARALRMEPSTLTRNMRPLIDQGLIELGEGPDGRSRMVAVTALGRSRRTEAQHHWRVAQEGVNRMLGVDRVMALHALLDECGALLAPTEAADESDE